MKKIALLLAMSLLAACGGGSTSGSTAAPASGETGSLTVNVKSPLALPVLNSGKTFRRLVITNPTVPGLANMKFTVPDYPTTEGAKTIALPQANGYVVEVLEYTIDGSRDDVTLAMQDTTTANIINYGSVSSINLISATPVSAGVTVTPVKKSAPDLTITNPAVTGYTDESVAIPTYTVTATIPANGPFDTNNWVLFGGYSSNSVKVLQGVSNSATATQQGPYGLKSDATFYARYVHSAKFFLKESLRKANVAGDINVMAVKLPNSTPVTLTTPKSGITQ